MALMRRCYAVASRRAQLTRTTFTILAPIHKQNGTIHAVVENTKLPMSSFPKGNQSNNSITECEGQWKRFLT